MLLQIIVIRLRMLTLFNIRIIKDKYEVHNSEITLYLGLLKMLSRKLREQKLIIQ